MLFRSVELVYHDDSYVEIKLVYISAEIRIRRQGPYLSIAVRGPDRLVDGVSLSLKLVRVQWWTYWPGEYERGLSVISKTIFLYGICFEFAKTCVVKSIFTNL